MKMTTFASTLALAATLAIGSAGAFAQTATKPAGCGPQPIQTQAHSRHLASGDGSGADVRANRQLAAGDGSGADVRANRQLAAGDGSGADVRANRQLASASSPCN